MMLHVILVTVLLGDSPLSPGDLETRNRQVIAKALKFLDEGGAELEKDATCINCHHAPLRAWALKEASLASLEVDVKALTETTNIQLEKLLTLRNEYQSKQWSHSLSSLYVLSGLVKGPNGPVEGDHARPPVSKELVKILLSEQTAEGSWKAAGQFANQRRPRKDADEVQTMWSVLAFSKMESLEGVNDARSRAIQWLATIEPGTTIDSRVLRILIEQKSGTPERVEQLVAQLLTSQHADGGWGWQPDDPSEAWPVGLALFALSQLGDKAPAAAMARARDFLAKTQQDDGSWHVEGKLTKNASMASYFGTAWAIIGLSRTQSK